MIINKRNSGFTIVELLVVIVVIGILAGLTIVSFTGVSQKATVATLNSDLKNAATQLEIDKINNGTYPISEAAANGGLGLPKSAGTIYSYSVSADYSAYLLSATATGITTLSYISSVTGTVQQGNPYAFPSGLSTNLVSYWKLDETSGTRNDSVSTNHLSDVNTVTYNTGKIGNAASFLRANTEYLSINDNASLSITGNLSTSSWFKTSGIQECASYITKWTHSTQNSYHVHICQSATQITYNWINDNVVNGYTYTSASTPAVNETPGTAWHHLVTVYNAAAGSITFYVDGVLVHSATGMDTSISNGTAPFRIGNRGSGSQSDNFDGLIDEVAIWSRTLDQSEVSALYNYGFGVTY